MPQIATLREKEIKIPTLDGTEEIVIVIRGLGGATLVAAGAMRERGDEEGFYKTLIDRSVLRVKGGLVSEDGEVFDVDKYGSIEPFLYPMQTAFLIKEIGQISGVDPEGKKDSAHS